MKALQLHKITTTTPANQNRRRQEVSSNAGVHGLDMPLPPGSLAFCPNSRGIACPTLHECRRLVISQVLSPNPLGKRSSSLQTQDNTAGERLAGLCPGSSGFDDATLVCSQRFTELDAKKKRKKTPADGSLNL